jgi:hypothetical protein
VTDDDRTLTHLDQLSAEFPSFHIVLEPTVGTALRFVARNRHPDVHPRIVITPDPGELRAALSWQDCPQP